MKPAAPPPAAQPVELEEVSVTGERDPGYAPRTATTATRTDTPILDVPQSIQVVPAELIRDQSATGRLGDLGRNVSGVVPMRPTFPTNTPYFNIRGFNTEYMLRNGHPRTSGAAISDAVNVERIEFLKGPSSTLYGEQQGVGGSVNVVSKRPTEHPVMSLEVVAGGWDFRRAAADLGGPLTEGKELQYRLTMAAETAGSYQEFANHDSLFIAPALSWRIGESDRLTLLTEFARTRWVQDNGMPVLAENLSTPRSLFWGEPANDLGATPSLDLLAEYEHRFAGGWKAVLGASYAQMEGEWGLSFVDPPPTNRLLWMNMHGRVEEKSLALDVSGQVRALGMTHALLFGASSYAHYQPHHGDQDGESTPFDPANPQYGGPITVLWSYSPYSYETVDVGVYAQDLIELGAGWKLLLGVRHDWDQQYYLEDGVLGSEAKASLLSPRAGLTWQPTVSTSLYASWGQSFLPQYGKLPDGGLAPPERGMQLEAGVKHEFLDGALLLTGALFQLTRSDVAQKNPDDLPGERTVILVGEQRSRGVEADLNGKVGQHLRLSAAAALQRVEVVQDTTLPAGDRLVGAPGWTFNVFAVYALGGSLEGLELGGGFHATGPTESTQPNTSFKLPGTRQLDAVAAWRLSEQARLQVNLDNLTDQQNFVSKLDALGYRMVRTSPPRSAYLQLQLQF